MNIVFNEQMFIVSLRACGINSINEWNMIYFFCTVHNMSTLHVCLVCVR
jgi:hypothetical protein